MRRLPFAILLLLVLELKAGPLKDRLMPNRSARTDINARIEKPGLYTFTFKHNGLERHYMINVPKSYDEKHPHPVVFALHGGRGSMETMAKEEHYGLITKSEEASFIAVFPNGHKTTWNAGKCCGKARDENIDDVGFIKEIIKNLPNQVAINPSRIYAIGMSNGGMMSYRLACEQPQTFRAIAAVAGTDNTSACSPSTPISVLHIHAKDDQNVLYQGGIGPKVPHHRSVTNFTSVPATVLKWAGINGCHPSPKITLKVTGAHCERYFSCQKGSHVQLCVTDTGGHSWPGGKRPRTGDPASKAIIANDIIWDFFLSLEQKNDHPSPPQ